VQNLENIGVTAGAGGRAVRFRDWKSGLVGVLTPLAFRFAVSHGLRHGLHSYAALRLRDVCENGVYGLQATNLAGQIVKDRKLSNR
jgi:hypothetical protein